MNYKIAVYTDAGAEKKNNQDSCGIRRAADNRGHEMVFAVLCDGMGGIQQGELASAEVVSSLTQWFDNHVKEIYTKSFTDFNFVREQLNQQFAAIHQRMVQYAHHNGIRLGTTMTAFLSCHGRYLTVNIGDSRIYEYTTVLKQLTQDQSLVAREVALGRITEEEAQHHPQRNVLLQCIGQGNQITPMYTEGRVVNNSVYLLCSDGLVHELSKQEIENALSTMRRAERDILTDCLISLTEHCKKKGETDNITGILITAAESFISNEKAGFSKVLKNILKKKQEFEEQHEITEVQMIESGMLIHTNGRVII